MAVVYDKLLGTMMLHNHLSLEGDSVTGDIKLVSLTPSSDTPKLAFYQTTTERGFIFYENGTGVVLESNDQIHFRSNNVKAMDFDTGQRVRFTCGFDNIVRINHTSATGNPSLEFPTTTILAFVELANLSVASMPFHLSSLSVIL